ncbi:hypothetical protein BKA70DRAFT_1432983 [Coprinopsis sp. MPI-PUGE-AT-0042]|nr:hypothetical protein BKA70DRAFT_1432983 [Coprinopsis sp. MPI-PUGE-AT-0042]
MGRTVRNLRRLSACHLSFRALRGYTGQGRIYSLPSHDDWIPQAPVLTKADTMVEVMNFGERWFNLPVELQDLTLDWLNLSDLAILGRVGGLTQFVKAHVFRRVKRLFNRWGLPEDRTREKMKQTETVLSGSAALATLLPVNYVPGDLDFYSPFSGAVEFRHFLLSVDYVEALPEPMDLPDGVNDPAVAADRKVPMVEDNSGCAYVVHAGMKAIFTFFHKTTGRKINVIQSNTESTLAPIFLFHSTLVMNWVSHGAISCAYPKLTMAYQGLQNTLLYHTTPGTRASIQKYKGRGFDIVSTCLDIPAHSAYGCSRESWRKPRGPRPLLCQACREAMKEDPYCQRTERSANDDTVLAVTFDTKIHTISQPGGPTSWRLARPYYGEEFARQVRLFGPLSATGDQPRVLTQDGKYLVPFFKYNLTTGDRYY